MNSRRLPIAFSTRSGERIAPLPLLVRATEVEPGLHIGFENTGGTLSLRPAGHLLVAGQRRWWSSQPPCETSTTTQTPAEILRHNILHTSAGRRFIRLCLLNPTVTDTALPVRRSSIQCSQLV